VSDHIIVSPPDGRLLSALRRRKVVIDTSDIADIPRIREMVREHDVQLHAVRLWVDGPLTSVPLDGEDLADAPLAIYVQRLGPRARAMDIVPILRRMNTRIFLSSSHMDCFTDLHLLSSLGVACGLSLGERPIPWEKVDDLMHYATYSQASHAPIEPFDYIASQYDPKEFADIDSVYFNSPSRFVHIDSNWGVALTREDLEAGVLVGEGVEALDGVTESEPYKKWHNRWMDLMLEDTVCAYCPAFRVCTGRFIPDDHQELGCRAFFSAMMDAAEYHQSARKAKSRDLWQL
jgi:hypothetical protein